MTGGQGSGLRNFKNLQKAVHSFKNNQVEGQTRGLERERRDAPPTANDPPQHQPGRPPYGYSHHFPSDPGPHSGNVPWNGPPNPQGSPPLSYNPQFGGQHQAGGGPQGYGPQGYGPQGYGPQGYGPPPQPNSYQPAHSQTYGYGQNYTGSSPPASHPSYGSAYQPNELASAGQSHQGWPGGQGAYPPRPNGPSLNRTATAPAGFNCEHRYPGDGFCRECELRSGYNGGR